MSLTFPRMQQKLFQKWLLKTWKKGSSTRCSLFTQTTRLGLPGLYGSFPRHLIHVTTRWWSVDTSCSRLCRSYNNMTTKSNIDLWPKVCLGPSTPMSNLMIKHSVRYGQSVTCTEVQQQSTTQVQMRWAAPPDHKSPSRTMGWAAWKFYFAKKTMKVQQSYFKGHWQQLYGSSGSH